MPYLTRAAITERTARRREDFESPPLGGTLCVQELSRLDWKTASRIATTPTDPDKVFIDYWDAACVAYGVIDPTDGESLFTVDMILSWANRDALWDEIRRIANRIRELSEVSPESLKSDNPPTNGG